MAQQLKRWESPRRKSRNDKGRGGSAKARQYKKRQKRLLKRLRQGSDSSTAISKISQKKGGTHGFLPFFMDSKVPCLRGISPWS